MNVLLTGASGYLGVPLRAEMLRRGMRVRTAGRRGVDVRLDLEDPVAAGVAVRALAHEVDVLVHVAALSRAGECAEDPDRAHRVNGAASGSLAQAMGGRILFVSTDLVFGGDRAPYGPGDPVAPRLAYGASKAAGEKLVLAAGGTVVRLPLLFGSGGAGRAGAEDVVRAGLDGRLTLFTDEFRTPLEVASAAEGICDLLERSAASGIHHLPGPERLSRYDHGLQICAARGWDGARLKGAPGPDDDRPKDVSLRR